MKKEQTHIFSVQKASSLDSKVRRLLQNPFKILAPLISKGMTVLDYGCGNGYFSIPISKMVGNSGRVYSVDIQNEMLEKLKTKLSALNITNVISVQKENKKLNFPELIDFAIVAYVVHEIPDQREFFKEIFDLLKPKKKLLIIEPDFIVSKEKFNSTLEIARQVGFVESEKLNLLFSKTRILLKAE